MTWYNSYPFKVGLLAFVGVAVMMSIALSLAFTLGAPKPYSKVLYTSIEDPALTIESSAKDCSTPELGACGTVLEYGTPLDTLTVSATVPSGAGNFSAVTFQVCYADAFIAGRPWRSPKDTIGRDKQCGISACKSVPLEGGATATCDYTVGDALGTSVYYFRALAENADGAFVAGNTNKDQYFQINAYNGRTTGIVVGVAVCSVLAWAILGGGLVYELAYKKQ